MSENNSSKQAKIVKEQPQSYDSFERFEIIDGIRYDFQASSTVSHQELVARFWQAIDKTCYSNGIVLFAPMDVYFDEKNTVQPDVIFISNENLHIVKKQRIEGVPDLLIEILSRSTGKNDRFRKKALYERVGVKEYWIADPVHFTVEQFVLENGKFVLQAAYSEDDTMTSPYFSCIGIDLGPLFGSIRRFEE